MLMLQMTKLVLFVINGNTHRDVFQQKNNMRKTTFSPSFILNIGK